MVPSIIPLKRPSINRPLVNPSSTKPLVIPSTVPLVILSAVPSTDPSSIPSAGPPFLTHTSIVKGCFYCHNTYSTHYIHRNKCPWFRYYVDIGTCHLNDVGELYLGLKRRSTIPLLFWDIYISQGEQVKRRTNGIE